MICMCICHFDDTNPSGGLDKQARILAKKLRKNGEDVVMLASTRKWSRRGWTHDEGLPIRYFWTYSCPQISGRYLPAALLWAFQVFIWVAVHHKKIDLFHGHQIRIHAFVGAMAQKFFKIPHISKSATGGTGADIRAIATRKYFGKRGRRFIIRHTKRFIATTASIEDDLIEGGVNAEQIRVIPNGLVIPDHLKEDRVAVDAAERSKKMLFLGRLDSDKNVLSLAESFKKISKDYALDFYGQGTQMKELKQLVNGHNNITLKGFSDNPAAILPSYGYLLLPSSGEGLSNSMLEAMLWGVVPIVTKVSGCVDHIKDGETGFFFDSLAVEDLQKTIERATQVSPEQWQEMSERVAVYAEKHFALDSVAKQYQQLYRELETQAV